MPFKKKAGGKVFTFEDGTSDSAVSESIQEYFEKNAPPVMGATSKVSEQAQMLSAAAPMLDPTTMLAPEQQFEDADERQGFDQIGQTAGGIAGGFKAAQKAQQVTAALPPWVRGVATVSAGAAGAFGGGFGGDLTESAVEHALSSENAPESMVAAVNQALEAGTDEAIFDAVGNSIFLGGGFMLKQALPGASKLASSVKEVLEKGGSSATIGQLTNNALYTGLEKMVRGAIVGGSPFKRLDEAQDEAIVRFTDLYTKNFSDAAAHELTDQALGKLTMDTIVKGKRAHSQAGGLLYDRVDEISQGLTVNVTSVKDIAKSKLDAVLRRGGVGFSNEGGEILGKVAANTPDELSFGDLHGLRSDLINRKSGLSDTKSDNAVANNLGEMITEIERILDSAATTGTTGVVPEGVQVTNMAAEAVDALRHANKFWKFGKEKFNNKLIKSILKKEETASKIGASVFRAGNREEILSLRKAIKTASMLDESVNFNQTWGKMKAGYLNSLTPNTADEVQNTLLRKLHKDKKSLKTISTVFTKPEQESLIRTSRAVDEILAKRGETTGLLTLRQAGQMGQIAGVSGAAAADQNFSMGEAGFLLGMPLAFAAVATSPRLSKVFVQWSKAPKGTATKLTAASKLAYDLGLRIDQVDPENVSGFGMLDAEPKETTLEQRQQQRMERLKNLSPL